jgi:hypothetical protein
MLSVPDWRPQEDSRPVPVASGVDRAAFVALVASLETCRTRIASDGRPVHLVPAAARVAAARPLRILEDAPMRQRRMDARIAAALMPVLLTLIVAAPSHAARAAAVEVPLSAYFGDLRTVPVMIGGQSVPFVLDTGGGLTALTPTTAAKAGVTPFGQFTGIRFNGEKLSGKRCGTVPFTLGGTEFRCEAGVGDLEALGLKGVGGVLALQSFEGRAFTLDLAGNRLILETPASLKKRTAHLRELTVRPGRQCGGASLDLYARALAPTGDLWLEMDCGNLQPVLLAAHAYQQLGVEPAGKNAAAVHFELAGLGPVTLDAQPADTIYDGLLNSAFFKQYVVTFDLKSMRVWVAPQPAS